MRQEPIDVGASIHKELVFWGLQGGGAKSRRGVLQSSLNSFLPAAPMNLYLTAPFCTLLVITE